MTLSRGERQKRYREKYPERVAETQKKWREKNPDYLKRWREENTEKIALYKTRVNPESKRASWHRWADKNRDYVNNKAAEGARRRHARKKLAPVNDFLEVHWHELLEEFDSSCAYCGISGVPLDREHEVPLSRGGSHTKSNIVPSCRPCNLRKGTRTAEEYIEWS